MATAPHGLVFDWAAADEPPCDSGGTRPAETTGPPPAVGAGRLDDDGSLVAFALVEAWYSDRGYVPVDRHWQGSHGAKLDLIVRTARMFVFCEVGDLVSRRRRIDNQRAANRWLNSVAHAPATGVRYDFACVVGADVDVRMGAG